MARFRELLTDLGLNLDQRVTAWLMRLGKAIDGKDEASTILGSEASALLGAVFVKPISADLVVQPPSETWQQVYSEMQHDDPEAASEVEKIISRRRNRPPVV